MNRPFPIVLVKRLESCSLECQKVAYFLFFTIITNISQEKKNYKITKKNYKNFYKEFFKKVKKKIEVSYEIVDVFKLDKCSKPTFCSKVAQKGKICLRLLELQKVVPNTKSCSKVAEHNQERPNCEQSTYPSPLAVQPLPRTLHSLPFTPYPNSCYAR